MQVPRFHPHIASSISVCGWRRRGATETRAHLNGTSYWGFMGIHEIPLRIRFLFLSAAYHTWLGKTSRPQTISERLPTKSDPVCLRAFGNKPVLRSGLKMCVFFPDCIPQQTILPILFCELSACSQWISHATWDAFSSSIFCCIVFSLQFST